MEPTRFSIDWQPTKNVSSPEDRAIDKKMIYLDATNEKPYDMPEPRGEEVYIRIYVDADHVRNKIGLIQES